ALYRAGRQAEALRAYQEVRAVLGEELGLEPGGTLQRLESAILRHEPELDWHGPGGEDDEPRPQRAPLPVRPPRPDLHNLPVALDSFVGRALEQKELTDLLGKTRLLTLTGVGGGGKTRLALEVAARVIEHYSQGVWLVALASVREEGLVASALAAALGLDTTGLSSTDAVAEHVAAQLAAKRALLLFDNCEHLVDASARLIHDLLTRCPEITVLATSREVLGLPGEVPWRVPPLSLPPSDVSDRADLVDSDAATLFWERASAARPGLELTASHAVDVARICRRLDGIPLALELAAARAPILGIHEVAERVDDCFNLLAGGSRTALPRHQTLRATLDWSYGLLPPAEQAALRRLAVFPAGFQLDAAEAVVLAEAGSEPPTRGNADAVSLIAALVDKSLVDVSDETEPVRYRLLQPVRHYALDRLTEAGEEPATFRRHRDFCLALAAGWGNNRFPDDRAGRDFADRESFEAALEWSWNEEDYEEALRLAAGLWQLWLFGGRPGGPEWLERVLSRTASTEHPARFEILMALMLMSPGDPGRQEALWQEAVALARKLDDPYTLAMMEMSICEMALGSGQTDRARVALENALSIYEGVGYELGMSIVYDHLGWVAIGEDDYEQARRHFERAVELGRRCGPW
ncbi:MAG: hypothetical protein LC792_24645, partial [Actinobacteria bacterium]|nr:hypothetical protein [Actinomycetota bacterium]